jgi:hypothetical protein
MAFTGNYTCNAFLSGLMDGTYNFASDTFKIALYTNAASLTNTTNAYTTDGEVVASGYTAGGETLTVSQVPIVSGTNPPTAYISFSNVSWTSELTARGALIYKDNGVTNPTVCVLDFGNDKTSTTTFTVQFPAATNTSAIIRIA